MTTKKNTAFARAAGNVLEDAVKAGTISLKKQTTLPVEHGNDDHLVMWTGTLRDKTLRYHAGASSLMGGAELHFFLIVGPELQELTGGFTTASGTPPFRIGVPDMDYWVKRYGALLYVQGMVEREHLTRGQPVLRANWLRGAMSRGATGWLTACLADRIMMPGLVYDGEK